MPNQLVIPFKTTDTPPIPSAVREYISTSHSETSPNAFFLDAKRWETLRADAAGTAIHIDRVEAIQRYHAQLVFILTKLPPDIGLEVSYALAFKPSSPPVTLRSLVYERASVLFNLAALYSQLAGAGDRKTGDGIKRAIGYYQNAVGTLMYIRTSVTQKLKQTLAAEIVPLEFEEAFLTSLECLMLAQAQECVWQKAVMEHYKNGLIAKLSTKVSSLYGESADHIKAAPSSIRQLFPSNWLPHLESKELHFRAAAQVRKSVDDLEASRYGHEISRLTEALTLAKRGYEIARRGGVAPAVLDDSKSILEIVQKDLVRAERDNSLIYHDDIPPISALPAIPEVSMVQSAVPIGLSDHKSVIGNNEVLFAELVPDAAKVAIDQETAKTLESLGLPGVLDALERPIGLPPSLLKKAEEVKLEDGPTRIETLINDVETLARHNMGVLDAALDILDSEADHDAAFRQAYPTDRLESSQVNYDLVRKAERYRNILEEASKSDELVRGKWDEWESNIKELMLDEAQLEEAIPSSTIGKQNAATRKHARQLRRLLESLDDIKKDRAAVLTRAHDRVPRDDPTPLVLRHAASFQRWTEIEPRMFDDCLSDGLGYYQDLLAEIDETEPTQNGLLKSLVGEHALLVESRREDPSVKEREHALQSLDLAYHKYKEIVRNLDEGIKFYNGFSEIVAQFKASCSDWANVRTHEIQSLTAAVQSLTLRDSPSVPQAVQSMPLRSSPPVPQAPHPTMTPAPPTQRVARDLPPPDSDEWESTELASAPTTPRLVRRAVPQAGRSGR
ncbi:BRO1-domain-containing protein [Obba rivulosa]|uniref:BRO1-domain-containing protein n=1 Tax=Obba rivulosa TaxID=1052685 RepID=A0A8E2DTH1_9APHY|nr:BRO1-domain-containing protein [Obba rivulosa]